MESKPLGAISIEMYDTETGTQICTADILFGLENLIVLSCDTIDAIELQEFLTQRAKLPQTYEMDAIIFEKLNLTFHSYDFGRMSEACVLYATLNHFQKNEDTLMVYPLKTEFISMIDLDFRYSNIYIWKCRKEQDNVTNA